MTETTITRTQIIIVGEVGTTSYGDLTFTDKTGATYKVGAKRKQYFEKVIIQGRAIQLNYAMSSFGKEYVYSAIPVADKLPPSTTPLPPPVTNVKVEDMPAKKETTQTMTKEGWQEKDRITRKSIERQTALNAAVEVARLASAAVPTTGVTTDKIIATAKLFEAYLEGKEVQLAKSSLIEAAKKLGAIEVEEGEE